MNKKFTFMVAALLAAGSFSSNAFAQEKYDEALKNGVKVYLGSANNQFMKATKDAKTLANGTKVAAFYSNNENNSDIATTLNDAALFEISDYALLGTTKATFKLKYEGQYVYIDDAPSFTLSDEAGMLGTFQITLESGKVTSNSLISYLNAEGEVQPTALRCDNSAPASVDDFEFSNETGSAAVVMYIASEVEYTSQANVDSKLNTHLGGKGFSLEYKLAEGQSLENTNIFAQPIKAFYLTTSEGAPDDGTYFATKYPEGGITKAAEFNASTFIVLDPKGNYGFNDADQAAGKGFQFKTVTGKYITATGNVDKGEIPAENAMFTVTEKNPTNAPGKLSVSLTNIEYVKDGKYTTVSGEIYVGIISNMSKNYLTTVGEEESTYKATLASSSIATAADLLKEEGPAVYTIKFTSGKDEVSTTGSEYDKYLYSTSTDGSAWSFAAEGTKYVDIKNPAAQWTISNYETSTNKFTFRNRLTNETIVLKLNKLGNDEYTVMASDETNFKFGKLTDGNYAVDGTAYFEGSTVKLTAATVDKTAGFATIEDEKLNDVVTVKFNIPETPTTSGALYINSTYNSGASNYDVKGVIDETKATKFQLVKFDGAASESEVVISDTVYVYNDYKYWNAEDEKVETVVDGDTLAYVTYAFKQVTNDGNDWYLSNTQGKVTKHTAGAEIPKFVLKENINGTYALIAADGTAEYSNTAADQAFVTLKNDGTFLFTDLLYKHGNATGSALYDFVIEFGEPTPSLKAESKHVAFNTSLGYVAMNENAEGIVAPVSSLKAEYSKEDLTFWLDTADSKAVTPSFLISKAGKFMYNAVDSAKYYDSESATEQVNKDFLLADGKTVKAMFQAATLKDSETITVNEKDYTAEDGLNNFKFQIVQNTEDSEGEYVIRSLRDYTYLTNSNGKLGFTDVKENALVVSVETMEAPTSNESVSASEVTVVAQNGSVVVKNAAGKNVVVSTILGQVVANEVLTSDNATINVPAGIVVVAVEGESFKINVR